MKTGEHARLARERVAEYLRGATRFDPGDIVFGSESSITVQCTVEVAYQLESRLEEQTLTGKKNARPLDISAASTEEFALLSQALLAEAERLPGVLTELVAVVSRSRYNEYADTFEFHRYHRNAVFTSACSTCKGEGEVHCMGCGGSGGRTCSFCSGSGSMTESCSQPGLHGDLHWETRQVTCSSCLGGRVRCGSCGGSGHQTCEPCQGDGYFTRIACPVLLAHPQYRRTDVMPNDADVHHAVSTFATPRTLQELGMRLHERSFDVTGPAGCLIETACFECECTKFTVSMFDLKNRAVVFGDHLLVTDAGRMLDPLVCTDIEALASAVARLRFLDVPTLRYAARIAKLLMASQVHCSVVAEAAHRGMAPADYEITADRVARAVSAEHVRKVTESMDTLIKWISASHAYTAVAVTLALVGLINDYLPGGGTLLLNSAIALVIFLMLGPVRWWFTRYRLKRIGGSSLLSFAAARGVKSRYRWTW